MQSFNQARANFERDYLIKVLQVTEGNVTHAARIAERNRTDFYKLLNKHELSPTDFKQRIRRSRNSKTEQKLLG
jgi:two-component system response regulator GlrR